MKQIHNNKKNIMRPGKPGLDKGMTMAEMLITVAIIVVLASVAFISVAYYQRGLAQKERDSIARDIFVAAQNHITMAKGEGYMGITDGLSDDDKAAILGVPEDASADDGIRYFIVNHGDKIHNDNSTILDQMLPFGSIDETVRGGGNYIIRYQIKTGTILDVFYCSNNDSPAKFNHEFANADSAEYDYLMNDDNNIRGLEDVNIEARRTYTYPEDGAAVLGWYDGTDLDTLADDLVKPTITVENGERLIVTIKNTNFSSGSYVSDGLCLKLIITGQTSGAQMAVPINIVALENRQSNVTDDTCTYILDSITTENMHFADLTSEKNVYGHLFLDGKEFIAGEDISIEAVAYSRTKLAEIQRSNEWTGNSLFGSITKQDASDDTNPNVTAAISNFRHLENLDKTVSNVGWDASGVSASSKLLVSAATQSNNLEWGATGSLFQDDCAIYKTEDDSSVTNYYPVSPEKSIAYEGNRYEIKDVKITYSGGAAGLFGTPAENSTINNLELINFTVNSTGSYSVGALAGELTGGTVSNVVAYSECEEDTDVYSQNTISSTGVAGGLVGKLNGGTLEYCSASHKVSGGSTAGGLVGEASSGTIDACYSGGHTVSASYEKVLTNDSIVYNVTATAGASGGLVGNSGTATIKNSYSTCSVSGTSIAGGLIGTASGGTVTNCYCTGLVGGVDNNANAFIGGTTIPTITDCQFFGSINEVTSGASVQYKTAGKDSSGNDISGVTAIDDSADAYESFVAGNTAWNAASPYDDTLKSYYNGYNLMTVTQLKAKESASSNYTKASIVYDDNTDADSKYFVNTHYGDWPAPEIFIINETN